MICSDEFGPLGRAEATVSGFGGLPLVAVPHPLADNLPVLVESKAAVVVDEVIEALTMDPARLADLHRGRFRRLTQRRLDAGQLCLDETCAVDLALAADG